MAGFQAPRGGWFWALNDRPVAWSITLMMPRMSFRPSFSACPVWGQHWPRWHSAKQLGWSLGTLKRRLKEGRKSLRIQRLRADLGCDQFAVREAANKALDTLDQQIIPHLEKTRKSTKSLEHNSRLRRIIEQRQRAQLAPEQLRQLRAVMVLELIEDSAAKNLLKSWASGPDGALLNVEASGALKRLEVAWNASRKSEDRARHRL